MPESSIEVLPIPYKTNEWRTTSYYGNGLTITITNIPSTATQVKIYPREILNPFSNYDIKVTFNMALTVEFYDDTDTLLSSSDYLNVTPSSPIVVDIPQNAYKLVVKIKTMNIYVENQADPNTQYNLPQDHVEATSTSDNVLLQIEFYDANGSIIPGTACYVKVSNIATPLFNDNIQVSGTNPQATVQICGQNTAQYIDTVLLEIVVQNAQPGDQLTASFQYYDDSTATWVEEESKTWDLSSINNSSTWYMKTWNNATKQKRIVFSVSGVGQPTVSITIHSGKKY